MMTTNATATAVTVTHTVAHRNEEQPSAASPDTPITMWTQGNVHYWALPSPGTINIQIGRAPKYVRKISRIARNTIA